MVPGVGDVHPAVFRHGDAPWLLELAVAIGQRPIAIGIDAVQSRGQVALAPPAAHQRAIRVKDLHPVVIRIDDIDQSVRPDGQPAGMVKATRLCTQTAPRSLRDQAQVRLGIGSAGRSSASAGTAPKSQSCWATSLRT